MDPRQYGPQIFPAARESTEDRSRRTDEEQARNAVPAWAGERDRTGQAPQPSTDSETSSAG